MKPVFSLAEDICALLAKTFLVAAIVFWILSLLAGLVFLVMLPWDFLVWVFNTDWRKTEFRAPLVSLGIWLASGIVYALLDKLSEIFASAGEWCAARS